MVVFALSCFGLLLFLWLSFGGPIPLKPQGYRVQVAFPEAATLATEADVRIAGVSVGKVAQARGRPATATARWPRSSSTASSRRCTPTRARCCARRRCWARPTSSSRRAAASATLPEGGRLADAPGERHRPARRDLRRARPARRARRSAAGSRSWRRAIERPRARLQRRARHAAGLRRRRRRRARRCSTRRRRRCSGWSRTPASTFAALTENEQQLRDADHVVRARVRRDRLAQRRARRVGPHLPDVPRRVEGDARAAGDASRSTRGRWCRTCGRWRATSKPTLARRARDSRPTSRRFFRDLDPLIEASKKGCRPRARRSRAPSRCSRSSHPFLGQLNPMLQYLETSQLRSRTSSPTARRRWPTRRRRRAAASATTCASSARSAPRARRSTPSACPPTAARPTSAREQLFGPEATRVPDQPVVGLLATRAARPQPSRRQPGCWKARRDRVRRPPAGRLPARRGGRLRREPAD